MRKPPAPSPPTSPPLRRRAGGGGRGARDPTRGAGVSIAGGCVCVWVGGPAPPGRSPPPCGSAGGRAGETVRHISASPRPRSRAIEKPGEPGPCPLPCLLFLLGGSLPPAPSLVLTGRAGASRGRASAAALPHRGVSGRRAGREGGSAGREEALPAGSAPRWPGSSGCSPARRSRAADPERRGNVCVRGRGGRD